MIVLLAMPGSLSTVVLAVLGGHPALWPAPELHIFSAASLGELAHADKTAASRLGVEGAFLGGLAACLHRLGSLGTGRLAMPDFERWREARCSWSPGRTLDLLEAAAAPRRLIMKSGFLAFDKQAMGRLRDARGSAAIVLLVRHPVDTVTRLLRRLRDPLRPGLARFFVSNWLTAVRSLDRAGERPVAVLKAEDILTRPNASLAPLLAALGLPFDGDILAAMMRTEECEFLAVARQLPGLIADDSFLTDPRLRPRQSSRGLCFPASWRIPDGLARDVREAAVRLGYD